MADPLVIDAEHPWPWLEAFPEQAARFFNGRDDDADALQRCVLSAPVTVLFGKSGLGKSSLLQAGLFPLLRKERLLPVYIRINHEQNSAPVSEQIAKRLQEEIQQTAIVAFRSRLVNNPELTEPPTDTLWVELHRSDIELSDSEERRWQPLFVLDQFEEIFTLCATYPERQKQVFYELGDLMENRIPKVLADRLHTDDDLFDRINIDTQPYRFLISLREDYLPDLEEWSDLIPRLGPNRYRLLPMSVTQATEAIEKTGGALVTHEDAVNIVGYLSHTQNLNEAESHSRRKQAQIEPALLSLMCAGLNSERLKNKKERLTTDNLAKEGGLIVEGFYDAAFTNQPESLRDFVEQHLITADGARLSYPIRSVETEKFATPEQIKTLVDKRLIRRENLEDGDRIELVHDRLAQVALQRRRENQQRKELLNLQQSRIRKWLWAGAVIFLCVAAAFTVSLMNAFSKTKSALREATALRLVVEGVAMTSGERPGGTTKGVFEVLAAHRVSHSAYTDEALQTIYQKLRHQIFMHENPAALNSVAFSPDGVHIVSGSDDHTLRLWNANTGHPVGSPIIGHGANVYSVAFSPDGKRIVSGSDDKTLRLWDAETGKPIGEPFIGHTEGVYSVAFSPDGKRIVSGSHDSTLRLWDANTGKPIGLPLIGHEADVNCVAFSIDGNRIVSGSNDNTLRLWDSNTGKPIGKPLTGHTDSIMGAAFSPDGASIVSGSSDYSLRLWDAKTGKPIGLPLTGHEDRVYSVAFSPDSTRIVSGGDDKTLKLWDAKTGSPIDQPITGHTASVNGVAFGPYGVRIVSVSSDKTLRLWDAHVENPLIGHHGSVMSVAFSPDGSRIVSGSKDNTLRLWNADTDKPIGSPLNGHEDTVFSVSYSPDGKRIASGSADKTVRLWNANTGKPLAQPLTGHESTVYSVAFSPDNQRVVSGSDDKTLRLWDVDTGKAIGHPLTGHNDDVHIVAFSPDGKRIVSGSWDKTLRLWDADTGKPIGQPFIGHESWVDSVAFSPDGKRIVSGGGIMPPLLLDANTGKAIGLPLTGHQGSVSSVAFSPEGLRIVSGSSDKTLRLWDAESGKAIGQPLTGHEDSVSSVAFSPDGKLIASGSDDKTLRLWPVFEGWVDELCKKLSRNMSQQEWQEWVSPDIGYIEQCPGLPIPSDEPNADADIGPNPN